MSREIFVKPLASSMLKLVKRKRLAIKNLLLTRRLLIISSLLVDLLFNSACTGDKHDLIMHSRAVLAGRRGLTLSASSGIASLTSGKSIANSVHRLGISSSLVYSTSTPLVTQNAVSPYDHTTRSSICRNTNGLDIGGLLSQRHRSGYGLLSHSRARAYPVINALILRRQYSDKDNSHQKEQSLKPDDGKPKAGQSSKELAGLTGFSTSGKHLLDRLPQLHRPSKEELLAAATGFWHRMQIRFKWFSIRSSRPFNFEEIFAFASWIFWGHILWVVIGTTTFFGVTIWALNTVFTQEQVASWVAGYLTRSVGVQIVFESAIVPRWSDGTICFRNVFISRRPRNRKRGRSVSKGSPATAAAVAAAEAQLEKDKARDGRGEAAESTEDYDDGNYTQFDLQVDSIEISLSFAKWFNGKGLLRDVEVRGVRGVLDRTSVKPRIGNEDPFSYRRQHNTGDFEIDNFKLEDVLLTVYQPKDFRPFTVSVFNCELPRLRKQWLFYDFLSANNISGSFDDSLFTIHPRQVHGYTGAPLVDGRDDDSSQWKKHSRLRIDGLNIDHLNRGVEGPFGWIYEGNLDIIADFMIPNDADSSVTKVMSDLYERLEASVTKPRTQPEAQPVSNNIEHNDDFQEFSEESESLTENDKRLLVMDLQIHLNDVRASVPIFNNNLSYVSNAAVRPIVAYINSHSHGTSNFIPISCRIVKRLSDFDGSWTVFDCGLLDDVSKEVYNAFVSDIQDHRHRTRRIKKVTWWAAQVAAQALFIGLAGQLA